MFEPDLDINPTLLHEEEDDDGITFSKFSPRPSFDDGPPEGRVRKTKPRPRAPREEDWECREPDDG